jgi:uncharacterized membrane protein YoaK (UPF0700 family)
MFRHEGTARSHRHNQILAGYLALVAGFVNSAGFVLIGSFTSHVTGNVGRFADDLALGHSAAIFAAVMVAAYFLGAFVASMAIESTLARRRSTVYGFLLLGEAALLAGFVALSLAMATTNPRYRDFQAIVLCIAMGLQNSLVTRLSGAVVRTTHLTGVVTDLGIEAARWFRRWRSVIGELTGRRLLASAGNAVTPSVPRTVLLLTIFVAFVVGSVVGASLAGWCGLVALVVPAVALSVGGVFALVSERELAIPRGP